MKFLFVFTVTLFIHQNLRANDASFVGDGATVYTNKENRVRMAKEVIAITYDRDDNQNRTQWKANCTFEFENLSDEKISLTMGFPNWKGFGDGVDRNAYVIKDFTTVVNDKPVTAELKDISIKNQLGPWVKKGKKPNSIATFNGAYVWPVELGPKAKVVIKNTFAFGGFSSNGPFDALEHMPPTYPKIKKEYRFWRARKVRKKDIDFANALVGAAAYITTTGQTWSGPIGEATITFEFPYDLDKAPHYLIPLPRGYHMKKNKIIWHFKNYSPKEEIALYYLSHVFIPEGWPHEDDGRKLGFQYPEQAKAWIRFSSQSRIDAEVIDQLISISTNPNVKKILNDSKAKLTKTKIVE